MTKQISGCLGLRLEGKAGLMKDTMNFLGGGDLLYLDGGGGWLIGGTNLSKLTQQHA